MDSKLYNVFFKLSSRGYECQDGLEHNVWSGGGDGSVVLRLAGIANRFQTLRFNLTKNMLYTPD